MGVDIMKAVMPDRASSRSERRDGDRGTDNFENMLDGIVQQDGPYRQRGTRLPDVGAKGREASGDKSEEDASASDEVDEAKDADDADDADEVEAVVFWSEMPGNIEVLARQSDLKVLGATQSSADAAGAAQSTVDGEEAEAEKLVSVLDAETGEKTFEEGSPLDADGKNAAAELARRRAVRDQHNGESGDGRDDSKKNLLELKRLVSEGTGKAVGRQIELPGGAKKAFQKAMEGKPEPAKEAASLAPDVAEETKIAQAQEKETAQVGTTVKVETPISSLQDGKAKSAAQGLSIEQGSTVAGDIKAGAERSMARDGLGQALNRFEKLQELVEKADQHVLQLVQSKDKSMTVTLIPERLGRVVLSCQEKAGQVVVQIQADNPGARDLLKGQEGAIRTLLEQNGYAMSEFDVQSQGGQAGAWERPGGRDGADGDSGQGWMSLREEAEAPEAAVPGRAGRVRQAGRGFWAVA